MIKNLMSFRNLCAGLQSVVSCVCLGFALVSAPQCRQLRQRRSSRIPAHMSCKLFKVWLEKSNLFWSNCRTKPKPKRKCCIYVTTTSSLQIRAETLLPKFNILTVEMMFWKFTLEVIVWLHCWISWRNQWKFYKRKKQQQTQHTTAFSSYIMLTPSSTDFYFLLHSRIC